MCPALGQPGLLGGRNERLGIGGRGAGMPFDPASGMSNKVDAFAATVVRKKDAGLDWVRAHAKIDLAGG